MTMPEDKLTEMARAMLGVFYDQSEGSWDCSREAYIRDALPNGVDAMRAAVACQREPSEAMKVAGLLVNPRQHEHERATAYWQAMTDALEDKP